MVCTVTLPRGPVMTSEPRKNIESMTDQLRPEMRIASKHCCSAPVGNFAAIH